MSEPMRFSLKHHGQLSCVEHCPEGEYVLHSDYARLKAEVERLTAENAAVKLGNAELRQMVIERGETAVEDIRVICRLEAEVERLTKAGDAMAEEIALAKRQDEGSRFDPIEMHYDHELIVKWNAAKEGKPHA